MPEAFDHITSVPDGYWFDEAEADRVVAFFHEYLTHTKGKLAGEPFVLEPWQVEMLRNMFGWKRPDGTRRYRTAYLEIPRKNGKSTLAAGIALYLLLADREKGAEVYTAAADREQASIVYDVARSMADAAPSMRTRVKAMATAKRLVVESTGSFMKCLSADAYTKHGLNAHGIIFDEVHAQKDRELWDVLTTSTGAREQPLTVAITTAGFDRNTICWELHDYAEKVRDGIIEDHEFLPVLFAADEDDDWTSPETWRKANPCLGVSLSEDYVEAKCREAQNSPAKENTFRRLHLNQWTQQDVRWLQMAKWDTCDSEIREDDLEGRPCYAGLDLASTTDVAACVLVFPPDDDDVWRVLPRFWIPAENARSREKRDRVPYLLWEKQGHLTMTPGDIIDFDRIRRDVVELGERFDIREVAIDRWAATQITTQLMGDGFEMVPFGQGFASLSGPAKELEALVVSGRLGHGGNPVLRWMASNVAVEQDAAGNIKPSKRRSTEKIDGIVAATMALGRAMATGTAGSVYEGRGMVVI